MGVFKALLIEAGIVLGLVLVVLVALSYFKVIDLTSVFSLSTFSPPKNEQNVIPIQIITKPIAPDKTNNNLLSTLVKHQQDILKLNGNNVLRLSRIVTEFEGKIISIDSGGGVDPEGQEYKVRFVFSIGNKGDVMPLLVSEQGISDLKIYDPKRNLINLTDLKKDDIVIVKVTDGILADYPKNFREVQITKK